MIGHENAGWVHEVGSAVTNVAVGDTVILHPHARPAGCAAPAGPATTCTARTALPRPVDSDGGMAEYLLTTARACVKLDPRPSPKDVAALADAGITAYHAVRKAVPLLYPGTTARRDRRGRPRPHRHPVPGRADRDAASSWSTATPTRSSWPSSSAPTTPCRRRQRTSTRSRTSPAAAAPTSCSTSWPSRARRTTASR